MKNWIIVFIAAVLAMFFLPVCHGQTETPTETAIPTDTPTETPVPTNTPTNTSAPTDTPVPTATPTDTPVPTNTPVPTATPTDTPEPTSTPTDTPTDTPVPTNTPTMTPTSTPTATATPIVEPGMGMYVELTETLILAANASRANVWITNTGRTIVWIKLGVTPSVGDGIPLPPFGQSGCRLELGSGYKGRIYAIAQNRRSTVAVSEL